MGISKMTPRQEDVVCYVFAVIFSLLFIACVYVDTPNVTIYDWLIDIGLYTTLIFIIGSFLWIAVTEDYVE